MIIINNFTGIGRLTADPTLRYIPSGTAVCNFNMAIDKGLSKDKKSELESQNKPTADFINIIVWGKMAENVANYMSKGKLVGVTGRIESGRYEKDGRTVYTTDVVASQVEFLEFGDKKENSNDGFHSVEDQEDIPF